METVLQLGSLLAGEIPPGAVNAAHATRLRRWGHTIATEGMA
jgi:D-3-phosphoglycerate dehydrogenase